MAKVKDLDPVTISDRVVEFTKSGNAKYMVLADLSGTKNNSQESSKSGRKAMKTSVEKIFIN